MTQTQIGCLIEANSISAGECSLAIGEIGNFSLYDFFSTLPEVWFDTKFFFEDYSTPRSCNRWSYCGATNSRMLTNKSALKTKQIPKSWSELKLSASQLNRLGRTGGQL